MVKRLLWCTKKISVFVSTQFTFIETSHNEILFLLHVDFSYGDSNDPDSLTPYNYTKARKLFFCQPHSTHLHKYKIACRMYGD